MAASIHVLRPCASEAQVGAILPDLDGSHASAWAAVPFEDRLLIAALYGVVVIGIVGFCVTLAGV